MSDPTPEQLAAQSDKFKAYEWLRPQAIAGNKHAQVLMDEIQFLHDRSHNAAMLLGFLKGLLNANKIKIEPELQQAIQQWLGKR